MWQTVIAKRVQLKHSANQKVFKYSNYHEFDSPGSNALPGLELSAWTSLIFKSPFSPTNETLTKIKQQVLCFSHYWNNFEGQLLLKPYPEHSPMQNQLWYGRDRVENE